MFRREELEERIPPGVFAQIESTLDELEERKNLSVAYRFLARIEAETGIQTEAEMLAYVSQYYATE